jgi:hypothetical protein
MIVISEGLILTKALTSPSLALTLTLPLSRVLQILMPST